MYNSQSSNLTAQEQMKVARATGTPLISYTSNADKKSQEQYQPGLFGALAAREHEKAEMKKAGSGNRHSMHVQQAIAQRQQQHEAEARAQAQAQYQMQMQQQQAAYQAQAQQMQAMQYNQMLMAQGQAPNAYGQQQQYQQPGVQRQPSWHQLQGQQYAGPPQHGWEPAVPSGQQHYGPSAYSPQQGYGAQMSYGGQSQQWQQSRRAH